MTDKSGKNSQMQTSGGGEGGQQIRTKADKGGQRRTKGGGGSKKGEFLRTSYMDAPKPANGILGQSLYGQVLSKI